MAIDKNGAGAWPSAWQEIGAVPYQLIITMPESTWVTVAKLTGFFLAVAVLVVFLGRKKLGYGRGIATGLAIALAASATVFLSIDFGPKRLEPVGPIFERLEPVPMSEPVIAAVCKANAFPSELEAVCAKRNPLQTCYSLGNRMSSCAPIEKTTE